MGGAATGNMIRPANPTALDNPTVEFSLWSQVSCMYMSHVRSDKVLDVRGQGHTRACRVRSC